MARHLVSPRGDRIIDYRSSTLCIGHRGARAFAPENTLTSFRKAAAMRCEMIELDVHSSHDFEVVVHHDDKLNRCTDVAAKFPARAYNFLSDFTLAELKSLDAGSWFVKELALPLNERQGFLKELTLLEQTQYVTDAEIQEYASGTITIPTLQEALMAAQELNLMVNIEIKSLPRMYPNIASAVVALVRSLGMERSVLISSFDHYQLEIVRTLAPLLCTGVLTSNRLVHIGEYLQLIDADAYHPGCYDDFDSLGLGSATGKFDPSGLRDAKNHSMMTFVWTCNNSSHAHQLITEGVTGIMTDYPNRVTRNV